VITFREEKGWGTDLHEDFPGGKDEPNKHAHEEIQRLFSS